MERRNSWELEDLDSESISSPYSLNSSFLMRLKGDESVFLKHIYIRNIILQSPSLQSTYGSLIIHMYFASKTLHFKVNILCIFTTCS